MKNRMPAYRQEFRIITTFIKAATLLTFLGFSFRLAAQTTSGSIAGSVVDPQEAAISGARVAAVNTDTAASTTTTTTNTGRFVFAQLVPGRYTITVEASGFQKFEKTGVILNSNDSISAGVFRMLVGTSVQRVEVHAEAAQLKTESGERSDSIIGEQLQNVEVNGRSPLALLNLVPGVINEADWSVAGHQMGNTFVNGSRNNQSTMSVDGGNNTDNGNNVAQVVTVSLDSVQEFKVLTAAFQAQYGHSAGGQISLVTKSGTRDFHGSGYWFHRNESLNATNWLNNRNGIPKPLEGV